MGLPDVFIPNAPGSCIKPENADVDDLVRIIERCPSGALRYVRHDGGTQEPIAKVNTARLWENGPVEYRGALKLPDGQDATRALMCRCGLSKNKPYCDNSHLDAGFQATADVPTTERADTLPERYGDLTLSPAPNGPLMDKGNMEIIAASGRRIATGKTHAMCRCGASQNKPFCDGSHAKIGFQAK